MKKRRVLVTAVGGDIGQSVIKCLKDADNGYDFYLLGCDSDVYSAGKVEVDEFFQAPPAKEKGNYADFIMKALKEKKIEYIIFISEPEIEFFSENRDLFKKIKTGILVNDKYIIDTFMDKYKTAVFLRTHGISSPATFLPSEFKRQLEFPLIMKQRRGCGRKGLIKINDSRELDFYTGLSGGDIILQEYLPDEKEEYTAGVFGDGKDIRSITFRRQLGYGSLTKVAELVRDAALDGLVAKIGSACNLRGSINIQFRRTKDGYLPFEINPRFSSTVFFRHFFGFRDVLWWIDLLEGRPIDYRLKYKKGVAVRRLSEVFMELEDNDERSTR